MEKTIDAIWNESYENAMKSWDKSFIHDIAEADGLDEDDVLDIMALNGRAGIQIDYIRRAGKKAVFRLYSMKNHTEEIFSIDSIEDFNKLKHRFGVDDEMDIHFLGIYYSMRKHDNGQTRMTITLEDSK